MSFIGGKTSDAVLIVHFFRFCYVLFYPKKSMISLSVMVHVSPVYLSYKSGGDLGVFGSWC